MSSLYPGTPNSFSGKHPRPGRLLFGTVRPRIWGAVFTALALVFTLAGCINPAGPGGAASSAASLPYGGWVNGNLVSEEQVDRYEFSADAGATYLLQWEDRYNSAGDKTAYVLVSAYTSDGSTLFSNYTGGPQAIAVSVNDTIYVEVKSYDSNYTGTYAIMYYDQGTVPPQSAPSGLRAAGNPYPACVVSWYSVTGASGYELYRSAVAAGSGYDDTPVYSGTGTSYTDTAVTPGTQYWYKVRAVNGIGGGPFSEAVSATPVPPGTGTVLPAGTSWTDGTIATAEEVDWYKFDATAGTTYYLQWDDRYNSAGDKTAYLYVSAYRASDGAALFSRYAGNYYSSVRSISVSAAETIYLRVESQGGTGTYAIRYYDPATLPPQIAPSGLRVAGTPSPACVVTWYSISGATGYKLYKSSVSADSGYSEIYSGTGTSYTDTTVTAGTQYWYKVCAVNGIGDGVLSAAVSDTPPGAGIGTALPTNASWTNESIATAGEVDWYKFSATAGATYYLQWDDRFNSTGDKTVYLYVSAYRAGNATPLFSYQTGGYSSPMTISVTSNDTIYIRVEGYNTDYTGTYAIRYYDAAALPPWLAPSNLRVAGTPYPACVVTWDSVSGATGYKLYRSNVSANSGYSAVYSGADISYTDSTVTADTRYWYKICAVNANGDGVLSTAVSAIPPAAGIGTALPADASWTNESIATAGEVDWYRFDATGGTTYHLQWDDRFNSAGGKTAYLSVSAYRAGDATPIFFDEADGYSYPQSITVSSNDTIYIQVRYLWDTGTYALRYYDPAVLPPQLAPSNLRVTGTPYPACIISWNSISGATGYKLYKSIVSADSGYDTGTSVTGTSYTDTTVTAGTQYWYKVCAVNGNGDGILSTAVSDTPPAAGTGTDLLHADWTDGSIAAATEVDWYKFSATGGTSYRLQWDDRLNGTGDKTAYISVSAYRAGDATPIFSNSNSGYSWPKTINVSSNDTIYIRVQSQGSNFGTYAIRYYDPAALPPQLAPSNLRAAGTPYPACVVTWDSLSGATGYKLYKSSVSADSGYDAGTSVTGTLYTDTAVTAGVRYWYKVCAVNGNGDGILSAAVSDTVPGTGIGTPLSSAVWANGSIAAAGEVDWYRFSATGGTTYHLQWDDRFDGAGGKTAHISVSAYRTGNAAPLFSNFVNGYSSPKTINVSLNDTIYIRVQSQGSTGTYAIRYYNPAVLPPQLAPSDLRVAGTPYPACVVTWSSVSGATGYKLQRSTTAGSGYSEIYSGTGTSYTDTTVTAGTQYWYKVCAVNGNGDGILSTAVSDTVPAAGTGTDLSANTWVNGSIATEVDWYKFSATADVTYYLQWDDVYNNGGGKTAALLVSAYRASDGTPLFSGVVNGYSYPPFFSVSTNDTIYIWVKNQNSDTGTYAIKYYE